MAKLSPIQPHFPLSVENPCKTLGKTQCIFRANPSKTFPLSPLSRAKLHLSTHFSLPLHQLLHRSAPLELPYLFHFSTVPITNTTINIIRKDLK